MAGEVVLRALMLGLTLLLVSAAGGVRAEVEAGTTADARAICRMATDLAERAGRVPPNLLYAIALVESGRHDPATGERFAWPWTVNAGGDGRYYPDMESAIRAVETLQRRGVRNIDVGCMQVNLHFHGTAFEDLAEAFDPLNNVAYATSFLVSLKDASQSWNTAVKHYHSRTRELHMPYRNKVYDAWRETRRMARSAPPAPSPAPVRLASAGSDVVEADAAAAVQPAEAASTRYLAQWPPRSVSDQRRVEALARSYVMSPR